MTILRLVFASAVVLFGISLLAMTVVLSLKGESRATLAVGIALSIAVLGLIALEVRVARRPWRTHVLSKSAPLLGLMAIVGCGLLLPEIDRVKVGATIYTALDRRISRPHAKRIREVVPSLLREMRTDPIFANMKTQSVDGVRFLEYVPRPSTAGAILFLHGNGGNSPLMPFAWKPFADRHDLAILCPSYGLGFWDAASAKTVERVRRYAVEELRVPADRLWLAGISDGGKGVTYAASRDPRSFRGLIYISPTMTDYDGIPFLSSTHTQRELVASKFHDDWRDRPVIVFQGGEDINVDRASVDRAVDVLRKAGVNVTYPRDNYATEDHFLFFGRRDDVFQDLAAWMFPSDR